ncbi:6032_t:CDS:2 [Funneliformis mosseae]|uniref:6032_t:CDS:1 n=1 Tax=Funneliformis mosseae TaxID=27381 RepID=A0A9N9BSN3_FUNMO|nr:6032_t:CDS:2 [Funneliformis mosseae]
MISEGLPEVSVPAVDVSKFVVDQQNNVDTKSTEDKIIDDCLLKQIPMSEYKPDSKTNNTVPEGFSFPQSEILRDKKNTRVSENSNNSLSSKPCNASSSFECDEKIPEFSLEAILIGSNKVTSQVIVDLFNIAMKARQKEILCWYYYYKAYKN